jgi:hypothetical protein
MPCRNQVPEPADEMPPLRRQRRRWGWRWFVLYPLRMLLLVVVLLSALALYVSLFGLPAGITCHFTDWCLSRGLHIDVGRIRWDLLDGVILDHVGFYDEASDVPVFEADRVTLEIDPRQWVDGKTGICGVLVHDGILRIIQGPCVENPGDPSILALTNTHFQVRWTAGQVLIEDIHTECIGISLIGQGCCIMPELPEGQSYVNAWRSLYRIAPAEEPPPWLSELIIRLNTLQFGRQPQARLSFTIHPVELLKNRMTLNIEAENTRIGAVELDRWNCSAELVGGRLELTDLFAAAGACHLQGRGECYIPDRDLHAELYSCLPLSTWMYFMPATWKTAIRRQVALPAGPIECSLRFGPGPVTNGLPAVNGTLNLEKTRLADVWVEQARLSFLLDGSQLALRWVDAVIGEGLQQGPMTATGSYDLSSKILYGDLTANFDPHAVLPILTSNQVRHITAMQFHDGPPHGTFHFYGPLDQAEQMLVKGTVTGSNFVYFGTSVSACRMTLVSSNEVLVFDPLIVHRGTNEYGEGRLAFDFDADIVDMDVVSTLNPSAVARVISSNMMEVFEPFTFHGHTDVKLHGQVDYDTRTNMNFHATVQAQQMQIEWFTTDYCNFEFSGVGDRYMASHVDAALYGGSVTGAIALYEVPDTGFVRYAVTGVCRKVSMKKVVKHLLDVEDTSPYAGKLSASVQVHGIGGTGQARTALGQGNIRIADGKLFTIPLLGPVSRFISKVWPGFGFTSQTDFNAGNAKLQGDVISLVAHGDYHFDERLDFTVKVVFMRGGPLASLVNLVTFPLTKLFFEFHLGGHLDEPNWRPMNLPKEMYLQFD